MTLNLTVSPDFTPDHIAGWYIFNTWLQRQLGVGVHVELYDSFDLQREAIRQDKIDLIYSNPYDASFLVREKGFVPIAKPRNKCDEAIIAVSAESAVQIVEDLGDGTRIATTDDPDVHTMGMIMLEPADLNRENTQVQYSDGYVLVAKQLLQGKADAGFFLKEAFDDLSPFIKKQLKPLITSQIGVIHHVMLAGPRLLHLRSEIKDALLNMAEDEKGPGVLQSMGLDGWDAQSDEETEFMIDLMDTLVE